MERYSNEGFISFAERATNALMSGEIGYKEWANVVVDCVPYASDESLRRCSMFFNQFLEKLNREELNDEIDSDRITDLRIAKSNLEKERIKFYDAKREYNEQVRAQARNELYQEKVVSAINQLVPINVPQISMDEYNKINTTALIAISDIHCGSTFEVKGLYGEIVNKYDYDVMQTRMWKLLHDFIDDDIVYDDITVAICGDCFENILRLSSLAKLKEPVIDTVIKFSEFLSNWIVELYRQAKVPIKVVCVGGNHDIQRLLGSKPALEDENLMKLVVEFLKLRLRDLDNIIVSDYTDTAVENIRGTSILFEHGGDKDLKTTIDYFSNLYNIDIDEIIAGHLHHPESKTIGITDVGDRVVTRIGSIVGVDTFAKKIRASARPSAYVALYTEDGKTWSRNYYL